MSVRIVGVRLPVSRVARVGCEVPMARARDSLGQTRELAHDEDQVAGAER
jgi:hypothetical protein